MIGWIVLPEPAAPVSVTPTGESQRAVYSESILPEPGVGRPRLGTELAESNGGDGLRFALAPIGLIVFNIIYKMHYFNAQLWSTAEQDDRQSLGFVK